MNLEDYAYEENGRWYVNPQVALDERNAFIDNYRGSVAEDNARIDAQTSGLGTQVPSQLGNLIGGESYFKSRFQTPQVNQTVADLRATAQAEALQTLLSNEIAKKQKQYKDAYRAASERASNSNSNNSDFPLYDNLDSKLKINVDTSVDNTEQKVSEDTVKPGEIGADSAGRTYWMDWAGRKWLLSSPTPGSQLTINPTGWAERNKASGRYTYNGKDYYYDSVNDMWYVWEDTLLHD